MARKRLNKKVALIGSVVFVVFVLAAIFVFLYLSGDPHKFIKDGDAALQAANQAVDKDEKDEGYEKAARFYLKARNKAKTDSLRVDILFKLVDVYLQTNEWNFVVGCWQQIIQLDNKNTNARFNRLDYFYILADSYWAGGGGVRGIWEEIVSQASEFLEVADEQLLAEDTAKFVLPQLDEIQPTAALSQRLGPYLYLLRGRAVYEMTKMGAVTDQAESITEAIDDFQKVIEFEPDNIDAYWYLAQSLITKGEILASKGDFGERDKAAEQAENCLANAVDAAGGDPRAQINLLLIKPRLAELKGQSLTEDQIEGIESGYMAIVDKFESSDQAYSALASFYSWRGHKNLDNAIKAIEKAVELNKTNVQHVISAANLYYRRFSVYGQKSDFYESIKIAQSGLELPDAQDIPGPRNWSNRINRISLYAFLANCYIEQVLEYRRAEITTESESQQYLTYAEDAVHQIEQLMGSGEDPEVVRWQGMLELAKGNRNIAVRKLCAAYEQFKTSRSPTQMDAMLCYNLAEIFKDTSEIGAVNEFLVSALNGYVAQYKPQVLLDYSELLLKLRRYDLALGFVNSFDENFEPDARSRLLRIQAYIAANQFDEAEDRLADLSADDPNTTRLKVALAQGQIAKLRNDRSQRNREKALDSLLQPGKDGVDSADKEQLETIELNRYYDTLAKLLQKQLQAEPNYLTIDIDAVVTLCKNYITTGKISLAKNFVNQCLEKFPDNTIVLFYKQLLSEPEPNNISPQRRLEMEKDILLGITDPVDRAINLGTFYRRNNEPNEAAEQFKKVAKIDDLQKGIGKEGAVEQTEKIEPKQIFAIGHLFEIALNIKDWELAEKITQIARQQNIDECEGKFFMARLAEAKGEYDDALARVNECLVQKPVFSEAYIIRSRVNFALENEYAAIEDARKAFSLNPINSNAAKILAFTLLRRNEKLGDNVSSDQIIETRSALNNAMALNPNDLQLISFYAEFISSTEPDEALALRQNLQKVAPSVDNALLLGVMATRIALEEKDSDRKNALLAIASSSFEQARSYDPQSRAVLEAQAEYYRLTKQQEKAEELLIQSQDKRLIANHYFRAGQFAQAREVLEQLYQSKSDDADVLKNLLFVSEKTYDKEAAKKYSEELLLLDDSVENNLLQIQVYLNIGLTKEADHKMQSFKEKYPDERSSLLLEVLLAMKQGRLKKAMELVNRSLESEQDNMLAWRLRGQINLLKANYDQAIFDLKKSKLLEDQPITRITLAKAYLRADRKEDAIIELKDMVDQPQASMEAAVLLEQIYLQLDKKQAIKSFYEQMLEKYPQNIYWHSRAGEFAIAQKDFSKAEDLFKQAWQMSQKDSAGDRGAFGGYLQALLLAGKSDKLFQEAGKYVDSDLAPIAFFRMAEARLKLGDRITAIQYCRKAIDKAGEDEDFALNILRRMYLLLGAEETMSYCQEKLQTAPDSITANMAMFNLMKISRQYNKALDYIDKCVQIAGPESPRRNNYILAKVEILQLAYLKTSDKEYLSEAVIGYESLLEKSPTNVTVLNNLAYILANNDEKLEKALEYAKRALEIRPNDPSILDTYAYVMYKNEKYSEADESLNAAIQQYEQNKISVPADVYEHLGMIKEKLGEVAEALASYKQALTVGADGLPKDTTERINSAIERLSD